MTGTNATRLWVTPYDEARGRVTSEGHPATLDTLSVEEFDLSADGRRIVYVARRPGMALSQLRSIGLDDGTDAVLGEAVRYAGPHLSRDGMHLCYSVAHSAHDELQVVWRTLQGSVLSRIGRGTATNFCSTVLCP